MPCKGASQGDRLVFSGKSEKDFLKELTRELVKRGRLAWDNQGRGASRRAGTHEGRKGQYRACGDPGPGCKSRPRKLIQMWVPGPCQKSRLMSCGARRVQAPEFLRSVQPASFHSGLGDHPSQKWLRVEVTGEPLERRVGPGGGVAQKPCEHVRWGTFLGLEMSHI